VTLLAGVGLAALVLGYHVTVPALIATAAASRRDRLARRWALLAAPSLATTALAILAAIRATRIDGPTLPEPVALSTAGALSLVLVAGLLFADLAQLIFWRRWTTNGWWLAVALAAIVVVGFAYVASWMDQERVVALASSQPEVTDGGLEAEVSEPSLGRRGLRTGAFTLIVLAAGTLLLGPGERLLRRMGALAAPGPALLLASLPGERLAPLTGQGLQWTAAAATVLLLLQLWLRPKPALLCRIAATAFGCLLAARLLATIA
jgi:hypothetical protein